MVSVGSQIELLSSPHSYPTYDSKVKRGLLGAVFVLQLQRVAATVVLIARCDRQLTAVLWGLSSDAATSCLDLKQPKLSQNKYFYRISDWYWIFIFFGTEPTTPNLIHSLHIHSIRRLVHLTGFLNLSQLQVMGAAPPKLHSSSTFSPALILRSPGNWRTWGGEPARVGRNAGWF